MFARNVSIHLKPKSLAGFTQTFESQVLPLLRKQPGFQDEIAFVIPGGRDVIAISLWDSKESADAYNTSAYPEILKLLEKDVDGVPVVRISEVLHSRFHKMAASAAIAAYV